MKFIYVLKSDLPENIAAGGIPMEKAPEGFAPPAHDEVALDISDPGYWGARFRQLGQEAEKGFIKYITDPENGIGSK